MDSDIWHRTEHLVLTRFGRLFMRVDIDDEYPYVKLGSIEDAEVPRVLAGERAELLDAWRDGAYDEKDEWISIYQSGLLSPSSCPPISYRFD